MLVDELICSDFVTTGIGELIDPLKSFFVDSQKRKDESCFELFKTKNVYISTTIKLRKNSPSYPACHTQYSVDYFEYDIQKRIPITLNHSILENDLNIYKSFLEQDLVYLLANSASRISIGVNANLRNNFKEGASLLFYYFQGNGSSMSEADLASWAVHSLTRYNSKK